MKSFYTVVYSFPASVRSRQTPTDMQLRYSNIMGRGGKEGVASIIVVEESEETHNVCSPEERAMKVHGRRGTWAQAYECIVNTRAYWFIFVLFHESRPDRQGKQTNASLGRRELKHAHARGVKDCHSSSSPRSNFAGTD